MSKKILIADDEKIVRDSVRICLEGDGYELFEAGSGNEALDKARQITPDLIILDLMMPDKWGYAVCEELKGSPQTEKIRVMFLTGRGSAPSRKVGELRGADDYLVKPFAPDDLKEKVKRLLDEAG